MDFLGWYTTGEQPTASDINVHKQVSVQNKQESDPTFFMVFQHQTSLFTDNIYPTWFF